MDVTLHFAALHYINEWKRKEERLYRRFHDSEGDDRRKAVADAAAKFGVARTLRKQHDHRQRYGSVLRAIDGVTSAEVESDPCATIQRVSEKISKKYGRRQVLSATTKLLWLKFRSPVIIYDRQARKALKLKKVEFGEYWQRWKGRFKQQQAEIQDACGCLVDVLRYVIDPSVTESEGRKPMNTDWRSRITLEPGKRSGRPCIRGTRMTVADVLSYMAAGMSADEIIADFPSLTRDDIQACLAYAAERERLTLVTVG